MEGFYADCYDSDGGESWDATSVTFLRPDGDTEGKDVQWCLDNDFFEIEEGVWSGEWYYGSHPEERQFHAQRLRRTREIKRRGEQKKARVRARREAERGYNMGAHDAAFQSVLMGDIARQTGMRAEDLFPAEGGFAGPSGSNRDAPPAPGRCDEKLKKGSKVEIHGLVGAKHLNGKKGKLKAFHSTGNHAGRWAVRIEGTDVAVKPENLKKVVKGIDANPNPSQARSTIEDNPFDKMMRAMHSGEMNIDNVAPLPAKNNWAEGLSTDDKYEWFSNCYQMRCDDDYVFGGCNLHGPYDPDCTPKSLPRRLRGVLLSGTAEWLHYPKSGDWDAFLEKAAGFVVFAFEKSDAQERWGSENVFAATMTGGRSLRYTAEAIYGTSVRDPNNKSHQAEAAMDTVRTGPSGGLLGKIGGRKAWETFLRNLENTRRFGGIT